MNALAFIRVSSLAQDHAGQNSAIKRAAAARRDTIGDWRGDKLNAKPTARAELERLLVDARAGRLRGRRLYVSRLDRLTRWSIADLVFTLEALRANGVEVVSASDAFDVNSPPAEAGTAFLAWAAETEHLIRAERAAATCERAKAEGRHLGRPRRMTEDEVKRARAMHAEGHSIRPLAKAFGVSRTTLHRELTRAPSITQASDPGRP
jgi:putative DNA-invertase from lambdoid prophage Rac